MSLTVIAISGILVGFLCLVIGFFMEETQESRPEAGEKEKRAPRASKKKMVVPKRKAA